MSDGPPMRSDSSPDETLSACKPLTLKSARTACGRLIQAQSLSTFQAIVGTLAGIASITGAAFSLVSTRPANTGDLVAIVQAAGTRQSVPDATVEVLTTQNALVATLTPDASGWATQELREGVYVVRVSHPRYEAEARRIQVLPRQTVELRASLRAGSSSPIKHTVSAVRRALRF
jgi:Carboxypeptidase regulatory-like domain